MVPLKLIIFSTIAFVALFLIAKVLGKKQIAQLDFIDYVIGISLGSIAAEMAYAIDRPFWHYLVGMAVFAGLDLLFSLLGRKIHFFKKVFVGQPLILMQDGVLNYHNLKRSKLSLNEFQSLCRDKGFFDLNQIAFAILETGGKLSVLPKTPHTPATKEDVGVKGGPASLSKDVILDGKVIDACLEQLGQDENWLNEKLGKDKDNIKNIAIAFYDSEQDILHVHYK